MINQQVDHIDELVKGAVSEGADRLRRQAGQD